MLLLDKDNQRLVLDMALPKLDQRGWIYVANPFPDTPPVEVQNTRLMLPPCRLDEAAVNRLRSPDSTVKPGFPWLPEHEPWEGEWVRRGGEILCPTPEDDEALRQRLEPFKAQRREEYVRRKRELADGILPSTPAWQRFLPVPSSLRASNAFQLRQESIKLELEFTAPYRKESIIGLGPTAGYFNWTLEIARRHSEFITPYLHEKWLREHGLDRAAIERERKQFLDFIGTHAVNGVETKPAPLSDEESLRRIFGGPSSTTSASQSQFQTPALRISPAEELVLCAQVTHRMVFPDGACIIWLSKCELCEPDATDDALQTVKAEIVSTLEAHHAENITAHKGTQATLGAIKNGQTQLDKKAESIKADTQELKDYAVQESADRNEWRKNPLGCGKEAIADYVLAMNALGIKGDRTFALALFGYGATAKECTTQTEVPVRTIKRDLKKARGTHYAAFLARTPTQRRMARQSLKNPDVSFAQLKQWAEEDPEKVRTILTQLFPGLVPPEVRPSASGSAWEQQVDRLT